MNENQKPKSVLRREAVMRTDISTSSRDGGDGRMFENPDEQLSAHASDVQKTAPERVYLDAEVFDTSQDQTTLSTSVRDVYLFEAGQLDERARIERIMVGTYVTQETWDRRVQGGDRTVAPTAEDVTDEVAALRAERDEAWGMAGVYLAKVERMRPVVDRLGRGFDEVRIYLDRGDYHSAYEAVEAALHAYRAASSEQEASDHA